MLVRDLEGRNQPDVRCDGSPEAFEDISSALAASDYPNHVWVTRMQRTVFNGLQSAFMRMTERHHYGTSRIAVRLVAIDSGRMSR